ncbi:hypothetical protein N1851_033744 [Merluccius polli]|uniref:Uncharacterized protein n=1 Tax=Merluccius polli TaxID=89951 RepID=A0AA47M149_MERPO|nr:hypothetical protein N1851_033744 [Merluccius polli]
MYLGHVRCRKCHFKIGHNKQRFDSKVRESTLAAGDRVLVRNVSIRGKHKIADRWSETIYTVVKQIQDSPVYVVVPEHTRGPERVLHRDLLLPCGFLPSAVKEVHRNEPKSRQNRNHSPLPDVDGAEDDEELSEDEDEVEYYSLHDQPSTLTIAEQDRGILQEEAKLTAESAEKDAQVENESVPASPEANLSLDMSALNPAAPAFEPEASQVQHLPAPEIVQAEGNPPNVPAMDRSEHCSPRTEPENGLEMTEESGNVEEHTETEKAEVVPEDEVALRRSSRDKTAPKKLTYPTLGNPLVAVVALHSGKTATRFLEKKTQKP